MTLTYEERFKRFKNAIKADALGDFFMRYKEMKEIEEGLVKEKIAAFNDKAKEVKKDV